MAGQSRSLARNAGFETQPEERFDRITRLACKVFHVPIALISLIDAERQWFKSRQGIPLQQAPRAESLCAHTILGDGIMMVPDTLADSRFADNPLVTGNPHVRFYAGHPIHSPDGARVGSLSIIDRRPRELSVDDQGMLADLAAMIDREFFLIEAAEVDLRRALRAASVDLKEREGFLEALWPGRLGMAQQEISTSSFASSY